MIWSAILPQSKRNSHYFRNLVGMENIPFILSCIMSPNFRKVKKFSKRRLRRLLLFPGLSF